jgi:hypothetical protein
VEEWSEKVILSDRPAQVRKASATYAERRQRAGWRRIAVWVPDDRVDELRAIVARMCSIDERPTR